MNTNETETKNETKKKSLAEIISIIKYASISASSSILEYILFYFLVKIPAGSLSPKLIDGIATAVCYFLATVMCFVLNKLFVFKVKSDSFKDLCTEVVKYYAVAFPKMLITTFCVPLVISLFSIENSLLKTLVNITVQNILFVLGYLFQKFWVFKNKNVEKYGEEGDSETSSE